MFAHIRSIGHFIAQSGIDHVWGKANLLGSQNVYSVLNCGQGATKLAFNTHEKTLVALYALFYQSMFEQAPSLLTAEIQDIVKRATENIKEVHLTLCGYVNSNEFMEAEKKFKEYLDECPQYKWIRQYMRMNE